MSNASAKGAQIQRTEDAVTKATAAPMRTAVEDANVATRSGGAGAAQLPRYFSSGNDQWERETELKRSLMTNRQTGDTPFGQVQFSDRDARALLKYEETAKNAAFDAWFGTEFHKNDLATRRLAEQLHPEYYNARERAMVERAKMALRINLIKLRGPKDEEDLQILFGMQTGDIRLGKDWDRIGGEGLAPDDAGALPYQLRTKSRLFIPLAQRQQDAPGLTPFGQQPFGGPDNVDYFNAVRTSDGFNPVRSTAINMGLAPAAGLNIAPGANPV